MTRAIVERILGRASNDLQRGLSDAVACMIVDLANDGEFDPDRLASQVLADLGLESLNVQYDLDGRNWSI